MKLRRSIALLLVAVLSASTVVFAEQDNNVTEYSNNEQIDAGLRKSVDMADEYALTWDTVPTDTGELYVLESIDDGLNIIQYTYGDNGYRSSKNVNGNLTQYEYEDSYLVSEISDINEVSYIYRELEHDSEHKIPVACVIDGQTYSYLFNDEGLISGLLDENDVQIIEYQYDNLELMDVSVLSSNDEWVNASEYLDSPALLNHLVASGDYIDAETGWYYHFARYFDAIADQFIPNPESNIFIPYDIYSDSYDQAIAMKKTLLGSSTYGKAISYSSTWYSGLSEVEVIARLIYGEASSNINQVRGVGWTVMDRKSSSGFPNTLKGVATASGQFSAMTSTSGNTSNSRQPSTGSSRWQQATEMACFMVVSGTSSYLSGVVNRPSGHVGQLYFLSEDYFDSNTRNLNSTAQTAEYKRGSTWYEIEDIHQLGDSTGNVFFNYQ